MDHLFTAWRREYVTGERPSSGCVLCDVAAGDETTDADRFVLARFRHNFVVLNIFPYTSGHVMVVPFAHVDRPTALETDAVEEMWRIALRVERAVEAVYRPAGLNIGLNLGESAGAGIAGHVHLHVVPRWPGDTSFMTVLGGARVLPEDLRHSWERLRGPIAEGE